MDKAYYKSYFNYERNHWWFRARSEILRDYVDKNVANNKIVRILNVGVATGATTTMLQHFGEVVSLEYEQECIDYVSDKVPFQIIQGSILELPFSDDEFDLVCAFDVIEHVESDSLAVKELSRVCKPTGSVLVTVPAFMSLWSEHDEINHHFRRYTKKSLTGLFKELVNGYIVFCSYFNSSLFPAVFLARKISTVLVKPKTGQLKSDFEKFNPGFLNNILFRIMKGERIFISSKYSLPVGVSLLLHWTKK